MSSRPEFVRLGHGTSLREAFTIQCRVVGALLMRELHTRYGRENIGYLWMILEPGLLAAAVAAIHGVGPNHFGSGIMPVPYAICGYGVFIIFRGIFTRAEGTLESNRPLLYHRMVTIFDMMVSRALLESAGVGMTIAILLLMANIFGLSLPPARPLWMLLGIAYMVWLSLAMSLICCAITHDNRLVARLIHPATYLLMPIAGTFFLMKWIPQPYRDWLSYLPFTHIFEMVRYGMFENLDLENVDLLYLTASCLELSVIGMISIKIVRKHVHLS